MQIVNQNKLTDILNNTSFSNFPRSILMVGEKGCGKHMLCNDICEHFNLPLEDISDKIDLDTIFDLTLRTKPYLYIIDGSSITVKNQNTLLKLIEEPLANSLIVILTETLSSLLPTIINRCQQWIFEKYSKDFLKTFITNNNYSDLLSIAHTPGKIREYQDLNLDDIDKFVVKVLTQIGKACYANMLTISDKIAFNSEKNKFNFNAIQDMFLYKAENLLTTDFDALETLKIIYKWKQISQVAHINQQQAFESFIINLWELYNKCN